MTIDKAIEVLGLMGVDSKYWRDNEGENAVRLGIEALKRIQRQRKDLMASEIKPLPGERMGVIDA